MKAHHLHMEVENLADKFLAMKQLAWKHNFIVTGLLVGRKPQDKQTSTQQTKCHIVD